uniref:Reverse transcriptase domain-containing protein n=1 Tax=Panagrolaimus sp. PS1159 TaxID=55785 RepID=A0AC35F6U8_9BILA
MEGLLNVKDLLTPGCFMAKIDLKDAYFGLPIDSKDSKYLVFRALGKLYAFRALPFGLATAPYTYTRVTKVVATYLRSLGFVINDDKSELAPSQRIEFLGFELDSLAMTIAAPALKITKVKRLALSISKLHKAPARQVAQLCGLLASLKLAKAKEEAAFWAAAPAHAFINRVVEPQMSHVIQTDASLKGWGMQMEGMRTGGRWSQEESLLHINALELKAIQLSLKTAFKTAENVGVRVESDNTTAIAFINRRGGTRSRLLNSIATEIWQWALSKNIYLKATHIAGVKNIEADQESRSFKECSEWAVDVECLSHVFHYFGSPTVDLFASRVNKKCNAYFSLNPDPEATGIDAFAHNWKDLFAYAFPPFNLIGRTIRKAQSDGADIILITPQSAEIECMEDLLQVWIDMGLSEGAAKTVMASWAPGTLKSYNCALNKWKTFCDAALVNPLEPDPCQILNFLQETLDKGNGHSSVATQRAAITALLSSLGKKNILQEAESLLTRFHKGMLREKPSAPKQAAIWDIEPVLAWIKSQWPLESMILKNLTRRCILLLAICSPKRASELAALSLDELRQSHTKWEFRLLRTKNRGGGKPHAATFELFEPDARLCPIKSLEAYLLATKPVRNSESRLFLSFKAPHKPVTSATVARWLKLTLQEAGVLGYTGHSTRSAATSKAAEK